MMRRTMLLVCALLYLLIAPAALAQNADKPLIGILGYGWFPSLDVTEGAIFDMLQSYGFISADDNALLMDGEDLESENIEIFWIDPGRGRDQVSIAVENAIDREPDALVTLSSWMTRAAINVTQDMDDPPAILFASVNYPYRSGIAESPCIKPNHVTGSESLTPYEYVMSLLKIQNPAITTIGTVYNSSEEGGSWGAERITRLAEEYGIKVEAEGLAQLSDIRVAADTLVDKGIEAFVLPWDHYTSQGLPVIAIVANEAGIPVFHPSMGAIYYGATVGAGFYLYYEDGVTLGRMLVAYLNGELDIAATAISQQSSQGLGVNLDAAFVQGIDLPDEIMEQADVVIEGGDLATVTPELQLVLAQRGVVVPMEDRIDDDRAFLAALQCTPERIAAEQAELDARADEEESE